MEKYSFLEHTADIKFRCFGKTLPKIFENAALAVSNYLSRGKRIKQRIKKHIEIKGEDNESLFYNFLEELIYLLDAESFVLSKAKVKIKNNLLTAEIIGDDSKNYKDLDHIKAATYSEMYLKKTSKGWEAQAVLDV
jgi:SHS2 domain-containing protein